MKIIGVNGIGSHGEGNIDLFLGDLAELGYETLDLRLPKRHFVSAWWGASADAKLIVDESEDGDVLLCHSFGCLRGAKAMRQRSYSAIFMFRPAMSRLYRFPQRATTVYCFHSTEDLALRVGRWIPFHPFGKAGLTGFDRPPTEFPAVFNVQSWGDHNADFEGHRRGDNVGLVDQLIRKATT